jgi:ElaB/YqjD/DUF883 family membrane-anchored ribosome-binding protein
MHHHTNTAEAVTAKVNQIASNTSFELHNFIADVEDLVKQTAVLTGEDLVRAKAKLSARLADAKESVMEVSDQIASRARSSAAATNHYVHDQPWKAIGAGAAVGLLVGFALARR